MFTKIKNYIYKKYWTWQSEKQYQDIEDTLEHIWGVKSWDDLTGKDANLWTMNDVEIIYHKKEKKYSIGVETMYQFKYGIQGEKDYIKRIFDALTDWMIANNYKTDTRCWIYDTFTSGITTTSKFDTIEELYSCFKMTAIGFINQ